MQRHGSTTHPLPYNSQFKRPVPPCLLISRCLSIHLMGISKLTHSRLFSCYSPKQPGLLAVLHIIVTQTRNLGAVLGTSLHSHTAFDSVIYTLLFPTSKYIHNVSSSHAFLIPHNHPLSLADCNLLTGPPASAFCPLWSILTLAA